MALNARSRDVSVTLLYLRYANADTIINPADANAVIDAVFGDIADADATTFEEVSFGGGGGCIGCSGSRGGIGGCVGGKSGSSGL
jgi:hypothetical protein